jgi:hypothetical protein
MSPDKKQEKGNSSQDGMSKNDANRMWESEKSVRANVANGWGNNRFIAVLVDWYSSILVFMYYLISIETMIAIGLSVYLTICELPKKASFSFNADCLSHCLFLSFPFVDASNQIVCYSFDSSATTDTCCIPDTSLSSCFTL